MVEGDVIGNFLSIRYALGTVERNSGCILIVLRKMLFVGNVRIGRMIFVGGNDESF